MTTETLEFAMYLTGHDKETIEQMYNDWAKGLGYVSFESIKQSTRYA